MTELRLTCANASPHEPLERSELVAELARLLSRSRPEGRIALLTGEAGIGKSTLVRRFAQRYAGGEDVVVGLCDPLARSRTLGPLYDMAAALPGLAAALAGSAHGTDVFATFLAALPRSGRPTVVVFEDVHWADPATLDLLGYLGRRLDRLPALVVLTYRDDELGPGHPLHAVLAGLPSDRVSQLPLPPLSPEAVAVLAARAGQPAADLHAVTGGNPLLVTEVLASTNSAIPRKVRALAQSRMAGLGAPAQDTVRLVAVCPDGAPPWLLGGAGTAGPAVLEECFASGLLVHRADGVAFRHELLRRAVHDSVPVLARADLHRRILAVLSTGPDPDPGRLAHHALGADDAVAVLRHAPVAARRAAQARDHREAAAQYDAALRYADRLSAPERAELLDSFAVHAYLTGDTGRALAARQVALAYWEKVGDPERTGQNLRWLSLLYRWHGRRTEAGAAAARAVEVLEPGGPGRQLALAYSTRAEVEALDSWSATALAVARRAVWLAEQAEDRAATAHALATLGALRLAGGDPGGREDLDRGYTLARAHGLVEDATRALTLLASHGVAQRDRARAGTDLAAALRVATEHRLPAAVRQLTAMRAHLRLDQGDWAGAEEDARSALRRTGEADEVSVSTLALLARLRARRGDPGAGQALREAVAQAQGVDDLRWIAPVAAARAEHAWLGGSEPAATELTGAFELALRAGHPWYAGELAWWLRRAGATPPVPPWYAPPYRLLLAGDWAGAAAAWEELGCRYEQAEALAAGGQDAACLRALELFDRLGAEGAARRLRRRLRRRVGLRVPRGPRPATLTNPRHLTDRQLEVLRLLAAGLSNADIAARLTLSVRTVDHHVGAVLAKLSVGSRGQAAVVAGRLGIAPADVGSWQRPR